MTRYFLCCLIGAATLAQQPPVPPLPSPPSARVSVTRVTNGAEVLKIEVTKETILVPKMDMPEALPVSADAPMHYYGIVEFKRTKAGRETENELFYFGLYPNREAFHRAHGVGNTKFTRRFKAVIRVTSELPNEPSCVWQRADSFSP